MPQVVAGLRVLGEGALGGGPRPIPRPAGLIAARMERRRTGAAHHAVARLAVHESRPRRATRAARPASVPRGRLVLVVRLQPVLDEQIGARLIRRRVHHAAVKSARPLQMNRRTNDQSLEQSTNAAALSSSAFSCISTLVCALVEARF